MRFPAVLALSACLSTGSALAQQQPTKPQQQQPQQLSALNIYDLLIASGAAANKCGKPDDATRDRYLANLTTITSKVVQALKQNNPGRPDVEVVDAMDARARNVRGQIDQEAEKNGCASQQISQLLALYKANADWKP
jgi:hypothetical protein